MNVKYEYTTRNLIGIGKDAASEKAALLEQMGNEGWELVSEIFKPLEDNLDGTYHLAHYELTFKRPKELG